MIDSESLEFTTERLRHSYEYTMVVTFCVENFLYEKSARAMGSFACKETTHPEVQIY